MGIWGYVHYKGFRQNIYLLVSLFIKTSPSLAFMFFLMPVYASTFSISCNESLSTVRKDVYMQDHFPHTPSTCTHLCAYAVALIFKTITMCSLNFEK